MVASGATPRASFFFGAFSGLVFRLGSGVGEISFRIEVLRKT
jgi:hypothetical protein